MTTLEILHETKLLKLIWFKSTAISCVRWTKNTVILLLLDLLKAFETVDHYILLSRLKTRFGFEDKVLAWFTLYLGVVSLSKLKVANH